MSKKNRPAPLDKYKTYVIYRSGSGAKTHYYGVDQDAGATTANFPTQDALKAHIDGHILTPAEAQEQGVSVSSDDVSEIQESEHVDPEVVPAGEQVIEAEAVVEDVTPVAEPVEEVQTDRTVFVAMNLLSSADAMRDSPMYLKPESFTSLFGAQTYTTSVGGADAVIEYFNEVPVRYYMSVPDENDFSEWIPVPEKLFRMAKADRTRVAEADVRLIKARSVKPDGETKPASKRKARDDDPKPQAAAKAARRKTEISWKTGDPVDSTTPFGLAKCSLLRALGKAGFGIGASKKIFEEFRISSIADTCFNYQVPLGRKKPETAQDLNEEILAALEPYRSVEEASRVRSGGKARAVRVPTGPPVEIDTEF